MNILQRWARYESIRENGMYPHMSRVVAREAHRYTNAGPKDYALALLTRISRKRPLCPTRDRGLFMAAACRYSQTPERTCEAILREGVGHFFKGDWNARGMHHFVDLQRDDLEPVCDIKTREVITRETRAQKRLHEIMERAYEEVERKAYYFYRYYEPARKYSQIGQCEICKRLLKITRLREGFEWGLRINWHSYCGVNRAEFEDVRSIHYQNMCLSCANKLRPLAKHLDQVIQNKSLINQLKKVKYHG